MDVALRAIIIFVFLWLALRISGKRAIAQLDAFDLVVLVVLGDLVSQGVVQEDYSLVGAMIVVAVFVVLSMGLAWVNRRFPATHPVLEGRPTILLHDGTPDEAAMDAEQITLSDLHEAAREQGVRHLAELDLIVLEPDGRYSIFKRDPTRAAGADG